MPTKLTKRPLTKTSKQVHKKFHMSLNMLAGLIVLGIVLIFAGFNLKNYLAEQQTLRELDTVGKDLKVIYDKILEANKGNVESSEFGKSCSESSVKYGRGQVTCGIEGRIIVNHPPIDNYALDNAKIESILRSARRFKNVSSGSEGANIAGTAKGYSINFTHSEINLDSCVVSEYVENRTGDREYSIYCLRSVPDFLPGYEVEK